MNWKIALGEAWRSNVMLALVAVAGGAVAAFAARGYLLERARALETEAESRFAFQAVVVARRDLQAGDRLEPGSLALRRMPGSYLSSTVFSETEAGRVVGRRLAVDLRKGEPVLGIALQSHDADSLASSLPPGRRALTVAVDELNSHAGMLRAGDLIDLYLVQERDRDDSRIGLLLEQVAVLATGSTSSGADRADFDTVTLLVDAEQAGRILLAQRAGGLSVVLRPTGDAGASRLTTHDSRSLWAEHRAGATGVKVDEAVELLLGGGGGPSPQRTWMRSTQAGRTGPGGA